MKKSTKIGIGLLTLVSLGGCEEFLSERPDKQMVIPSDLTDLQALLDNTQIFNFDPNAFETVADNYYLTETGFNSLGEGDRAFYIWDEGREESRWNSYYQRIYYCNQILASLKKMDVGHQVNLAHEIEGMAHFWRGYAYFKISQLFCEPYDDVYAETEIGLPLRVVPDITVNPKRSTLKQTYELIVSDLHAASALLRTAPIQPIPTRPSMAAVMACLADVYMTMDDYENAECYADTALMANDALVDFNDLDTVAAFPFSQWMPEILLQSSFTHHGGLRRTLCNVDTVLFRLYEEIDLRKHVLYSQRADGTQFFKGDYATKEQPLFSGITTAEVFLIAAECKVRNEKAEQAESLINTLLEKRYIKGSFKPILGLSNDSLLARILLERRKELAFRGKRLHDLRRLNRDPRFAETLYRNIGQSVYVLPPGDKRYLFQIPKAAQDLGGYGPN